MLSIVTAGSEAMFADLGHFSYRAIQVSVYAVNDCLCLNSQDSHPCCIWLMQIAFTSCVYPALVLAYMGQAAYLSKHHIISNSYQIGFYVYVPGAFSFFPSHKVLISMSFPKLF